MSKEWALVERSTWDHLNAVASSEIVLNPQIAVREATCSGLVCRSHNWPADKLCHDRQLGVMFSNANEKCSQWAIVRELPQCTPCTHWSCLSLMCFEFSMHTVSHFPCNQIHIKHLRWTKCVCFFKRFTNSKIAHNFKPFHLPFQKLIHCSFPLFKKACKWKWHKKKAPNVNLLHCHCHLLPKDLTPCCDLEEKLSSRPLPAAAKEHLQHCIQWPVIADPVHVGATLVLTGKRQGFCFCRWCLLSPLLIAKWQTWPPPRFWQHNRSLTPSTVWSS